LVRGDRALLPEDGLLPDLDDALVAADLRPVADPREAPEPNRRAAGDLQRDAAAEEHRPVRLPAPAGRSEQAPPQVAQRKPRVLDVEHPVAGEEAERPEHGRAQ